MRKIKSEGLSEVKKEDHLKFRTLREFGTLSGLSELKGDEIVEFRTFRKFGTLVDPPQRLNFLHQITLFIYTVISILIH